MPIQGLTNLANLGELVQAGLPNITGQLINTYTSNVSGNFGAFVGTTVSGNRAANTVSPLSVTNYTFDASRSSLIYGRSSTVQQEQIRYPYFIQIATGSETESEIINTLELNNPYSMFDSKYINKTLSNLSWLKSNGQNNPKSVYVKAYEALQVEYNTDIGIGDVVTLPSGTEYIKQGLSVKLSTEDYTDYDFVLNTTTETFKLPLLNGEEDIISNNTSNLEFKASGSTYTAPANGWVAIRGLFNAYGYFNLINNGKVESIADYVNDDDGFGLYIPVKKGDVFSIYYTNVKQVDSFRFIYNKGNGSLYYYVGETVQDANLINAGRVMEAMATMATMATKKVRNFCKFSI